MRLQIGSLLLSLCMSTNVSAQELKIDALLPSVVVRQDSAIMTFKMKVSATEMNSRNSINLIPMLRSNSQIKDFSEIILNGERAHKTYRRANAMKKRKSKNKNENSINTIREYKFTGEAQEIEYRASVPAENWMQFAEIVLKREDRNEDGMKIKSEILPMPNQKVTTSLYQAAGTNYTEPSYSAETPVLPIADNTVSSSMTASAPVSENFYKGSFLPPESDATDERNKKELNFNLEEARVMIDVNPRILSLRELYTVALSYKEDKEMFYRIIDISVKSYPADPVANLNAASAAIERGNIRDAGRYLQMASRETLAYKNCRGVFELLTNNTYEGIRLLKSAKAEGSEEAAYNLKQFFKSRSTK